VKTSSLLLFGGKGSGGLGPAITPIPRSPLGPFLQPVTYATTLPFVPPTGRDLLFYRGNFCGLQISNAPVVPGCNDQHPQTVMACLLDNYPEAFQHQYLQTYAEAGYTHLQRSIGHALFFGGSLASYNTLSALARSQYGLYCDHWIIGGPALMAQNQDATFWKPALDPILDSIIGSGTLDLACVGWQLDSFNIPGNPLISIIAYIATKIPKTAPLFTHWVNEALAWWVTGGQVWSDQYQTLDVSDRFTWWQAMGPYLTGGHHQGSNIMAITDPATYQAKLLDTLNPFGGDNGKGTMGQSHRNGIRNFILNAFEVTAQFQFDNMCSEMQGDESNYLALCPISNTGYCMGGYGNGGRYPTGVRV
jgi:hypothetical protein